MAITSGFYNSLSGDRTYDATQMSKLFKGIITDGVFMNVGEGLVVVQNIGMNIGVSSGRAWFNNSWIDNDSTAIISVDQSEVVLNRIDTIAIEINSEDAVRANTIKCIKGTPGSNPEPPELTSTAFVHQYPLAHINIPSGATTITASMITNTIGTEDCPFITGILDAMDTSSLYNQFLNDFENWFNDVKGQLTTDPAGNLQLQINDIEYTTEEHSGTLQELNSLYTYFDGSEDRHKELLIVNWRPKKTNGCGDQESIEMTTNKNVYDYIPFDPSTVEKAYANVMMPSDYNGGELRFKYYWLHPSASSFEVIFGLSGVFLGNNVSLDIALPTPIYVLDAGGTALKLYKSSASASLSLGGSFEQEAMVQFQIERKATDAQDTLNVDAYLLGVKIYYPVSGGG